MERSDQRKVHEQQEAARQDLRSECRYTGEGCRMACRAIAMLMFTKEQGRVVDTLIKHKFCAEPEAARKELTIFQEKYGV